MMIPSRRRSVLHGARGDAGPVVVRIENLSVMPTIHVLAVMSGPEMLMKHNTCGQHYHVTYTEWRGPTATEEPEYIARSLRAVRAADVVCACVRN